MFDRYRKLVQDYEKLYIEEATRERERERKIHVFWCQRNKINTLSKISTYAGWFWNVGGWSELKVSNTVIPRVVGSIA